MPVAALLSHQQNVAGLIFTGLADFRTSRVDQATLGSVVDQIEEGRLVDQADLASTADQIARTHTTDQSATGRIVEEP